MHEKTELMLSIMGIMFMALVIGYIITSYFNVVPPAMSDFGKWATDNTYIIAFVLCFFATCYVIVKLKVKGHV